MRLLHPPRRAHLAAQPSAGVPWRRKEFKSCLSGGLEGTWDDEDLQKQASEQFHSMDKMGNENGLLEVRGSPNQSVTPASHLRRTLLSVRLVPQLSEWLRCVIENGSEQSDAEFQVTINAWHQLINHKTAVQQAEDGK